MMPNAAIVIRGETNAFWEIRLGREPAAMVREAGALARTLVTRAREEHEKRGAPALTELLNTSAAELAAGDAISLEGPPAALSRALRHFTRAQVRAQQVRQALTSPLRASPRPRSGRPTAQRELRTTL